MSSIYKEISKKWWSKKRTLYNFGLISSGIISFFLYAFLGEKLIMPYDNEFEITLFTVIFQGIGFLIMLLFANLFYNLGYFADIKFNKKNSTNFRVNLFIFGFFFSIFLPLLIPILIVLTYLIKYS